MLKDKRILKARADIAEAERKVFEAKEIVNKKRAELVAAYEEVFEENVCKKGERLVCKNGRIDGFYKGFRFFCGSIDLVLCPAKKDGTMSKVERYCYQPDDIIEEFLEKQQ